MTDANDIIKEHGALALRDNLDGAKKVEATSPVQPTPQVRPL